MTVPLTKIVYTCGDAPSTVTGLFRLSHSTLFLLSPTKNESEPGLKFWETCVCAGGAGAVEILSKVKIKQSFTAALFLLKKSMQVQ